MQHSAHLIARAPGRGKCGVAHEMSWLAPAEALLAFAPAATGAGVCLFVPRGCSADML